MAASDRAPPSWDPFFFPPKFRVFLCHRARAWQTRTHTHTHTTHIHMHTHVRTHTHTLHTYTCTRTYTHAKNRYCSRYWSRFSRRHTHRPWQPLERPHPPPIPNLVTFFYKIKICWEIFGICFLLAHPRPPQHTLV
jgi:hypothetical protein